MSYDMARGVTVLFGGRSNGVDNGDTWEWNGAEWTHRSDSGPSPRRLHTMCFDTVRGLTVLFGGLANGYSNETWEWDGAAWTQRMVGSPPARANCGLPHRPGASRVRRGAST